ncbi:MAG: DUF86 domain-containing protein [Candidatus Lambdaproteobacteria bacterium]|nr:DUF86 domain-containing protein [Candidatus Lambdaproteobacteria bacterium]
MRKLLEDILEAGNAIQAYTAGRTEADYLANPMLRDAVERRFEIIGEALRRLRELDAATFARISDAGSDRRFQERARPRLRHRGRQQSVVPDRLWASTAPQGGTGAGRGIRGSALNAGVRWCPAPST